MPLTLGYWDIRGLGEPSRLLLRFTGSEWEDKRHPLEFGAWMAVKFNLGLDFPNLPYLIDGDLKVSQSVAIIRYLGRKFNLAASDEAERVRLDLAEQEIMDMKMAQITFCYNPDIIRKDPAAIAELKLKLTCEYTTVLTVKLGSMDKFLGAGPWMLGERITYVDFMAYEYFDHIKRQFPENFKDASNINAFMDRFKALPKMREWFNSEQYEAGGYIHAPFAAWHGKE